MTYFITGGSGSFGKRFAKYIIKNTADNIIVYSRDELKHWEMNNELQSDRVKYIIGDVRDYESLKRNMPFKCRVVHAAALKHVSTGETQIIETIKTNVDGTQNVVNVANEKSSSVVLISTDKAVYPICSYGASKMIAENVTLQSGHRVVRFGNIFGSSGSILHIFKSQAAIGNVFSITDYDMTRFLVTFESAVKFTLDAFKKPCGLYFPEMKACFITDLAFAFCEDAELIEVGIQRGEKLSEVISLTPYIDSAGAEKYTIEELRGLIDGSL